MSDDEVKKLLELVELTKGESIDVELESTDFEKFVLDANVLPGKDEVRFSLLWDYYFDHYHQNKNKIKFAEFLDKRLEKIRKGNWTYYMVNKESLKISTDEMKRKIGERLYVGKEKK